MRLRLRALSESSVTLRTHHQQILAVKDNLPAKEIRIIKGVRI